MSNNNPGCLGFILQSLGLLPKNIDSQKSLENEKYPYAKRDDFLSDSELSFYKVLVQVVGEKAIVCPKVSLSDVLFIKTNNRNERQLYFNKISRKHVDFILCSPDRMQIICGIELDDSSHQRADRIERDEFVEKAFVSAGVKLIRFENKRTYSLNEVELKLAPVIEKESPTVEANNSSGSITAFKQSQIPICPKCGITMILRTAKAGESKGQQFYGCSNYPKCREVKNII